LRYFESTKDVIIYQNSASADPEMVKKQDREFLRNLRLYHKHLERIADRLGPGAHKFFRWGFAETGLHDGFLLSLNMGDAVSRAEGDYSRLDFDNSRSIVQLRALSYEKDLLHTFTFKGLRKVMVDIPSGKPLWFTPGKTLGQIYSYEATAVSSKYLRCEWLLDSGGTIAVEFQKVMYRCEKAIKIKERARGHKGATNHKRGPSRSENPSL
jgi:hypothetical protein